MGTRLGRDDMTRSSKRYAGERVHCDAMDVASKNASAILVEHEQFKNLWRESGSVERSCARRVRSVAIVPFNVTLSPMNYPDDAVSSMTLIGGTG